MFYSEEKVRPNLRSQTMRLQGNAETSTSPSSPTKRYCCLSGLLAYQTVFYKPFFPCKIGRIQHSSTDLRQYLEAKNVN